MKMRIGELARMAGCQVVTIRYYEKEGLLPPPERSDGNYRLYDEAQVERLRFIRHCRLHGMTLDEIRQLLEFQENPVSDCSWVDDLVSRHIENVNSQIASLQQLKKRLEALRHECSGGRHGDTAGSTQLPQRHAAVTGDGLFRAQGAQGIGEPGIGVGGQIDIGPRQLVRLRHLSLIHI